MIHNYTTRDFPWPHYKHEGNLLSVFCASGVMSPILRKAREVYPGTMVKFVDFQDLIDLYGYEKEA